MDRQNLDRTKKRHPFGCLQRLALELRGEGCLFLCLVSLLILPGFIPEREFHSIPEAQLVVNYAEVVLDNVFGSPEGIRNFPVLTAFSDELDDGMFSGIWATGIDCFSDHNCLL